MANKLKKYQGNEGSSETKKRNPPKVKTRTVTTNPGGYSKTIVKTKTIDRPGKQGTTTTTRTRPTIKGVASDYASGVRKTVYGAKEAINNKRTEIKNRRENKERQKALDSLKGINTAPRDYTPKIKRPINPDTAPGPTTPGQRINPDTMEIKMAPGEAKKGGTIRKKMAMGGTSKKSLKTYQTGNPVKLKDSPLSSRAAEKGDWDPMAKGHYMASNALSAADNIEAMNQLKKADPGALSAYGYQTTSKGNVVNENFASQTKGDASRLRKMASGRPIGDSQRRQSEQSLRGRKLAEGIQLPSMEKSKKPIIEAPKIDVAGARAKVKADAQKEFYINSKGVKVYVEKKGGPISTSMDKVQAYYKNKKR